MINTYFSLPTKVYIGMNIIDDLDSICANSNYKRGLLITDKLFVNNGTADIIKLKCSKIVDVFCDIEPNPKLRDVALAAKRLNELDADFAIALGGGSAIDLAKFACSLAKAEGTAYDYFYKRKIFIENKIPLIAMPTTAGTGSEVTAVSVCNDETTGAKAPLLHPNFYPSVAVVDPMLTISVPPKITAATGLDALSHALEGYWSVNHNPICDIFAKHSAKLIFDNIITAYNNGKDIEARYNMSLASTYAGLAFAIPKTAGVHACSYPLSEKYGLSHGEACALTLDGFIKFNKDAEGGRVNKLAVELGFVDALDMAKRVLEIKTATAMRITLKDCDSEDIRSLAKECVAHPLMNNNPQKITEDMLINLFEELNNGKW